MSERMQRPIYLDYAATTPVDPRVAEVMLPLLGPDGCYANPASTHAAGRAARALVEDARAKVAACLGCRPTEIVWTSGATEADNLAIKGVAYFHRGRGRHIVTCRTEHKAVIDTCRQLEREGFEVTYLTPDEHGLLDAVAVDAALREDTVLVSVMHVNNELGVIQDIRAIGELCERREIAFHVDAAQSVGKLPLDLSGLPVSLAACSAHKVYGPKGIGALYVRERPHVGIQPLMHGGGHERGLRSGTLPVHQIVAMGEAFALASSELEREDARVRSLCDRLWEGIAGLAGVVLNGHPERRVGGILNVSFEGVEGESLLFALRDLAVSSGSACSSASNEPSYVLRALGRSDQLAQSSLRFSLGRFTTPAEIELAVELITEQVSRLRALAPV